MAPKEWWLPRRGGQALICRRGLRLVPQACGKAPTPGHFRYLCFDPLGPFGLRLIRLAVKIWAMAAANFRKIMDLAALISKAFPVGVT